MLGEVANKKGYKRSFAMVPNYRAGKDALAGFKRTYKGEIVEEGAGPAQQPSTGSRSYPSSPRSKPDALFAFMPGGLGIGMIKAVQPGRPEGADPDHLGFHRRRGDAAGAERRRRRNFRFDDLGARHDNPQNKKFVAAYEAAYHAVPGSYAMQAYDAAMLIDSAVRAVKGNVSDVKAVSAALKKADFHSLRGPFKFNVNGYPIEDFYLTKVVKRPDGKFQTSIVEKVVANSTNSYAKDCKQ